MSNQPDQPPPIIRLLMEDERYQFEAYQFVRDALTYAQEELEVGGIHDPSKSEGKDAASSHITGQQLCEAIRLYALDQYGLLAQQVLKSWGVTCTGDFGEIVYNLIKIEAMKKSDSDRREDFDDVYDFDEALQRDFKISMPEK